MKKKIKKKIKKKHKGCKTNKGGWWVVGDFKEWNQHFMLQAGSDYSTPAVKYFIDLF